MIGEYSVHLFFLLKNIFLFSVLTYCILVSYFPAVNLFNKKMKKLSE